MGEPKQRSPHRQFEILAHQKGFQIIAGVDEVGRGCLAGPVIAASVVLPVDRPFEGVNDSKKLTPQKREELFVLIMSRALAVGVGRVESEEIDQINIGQASLKAMRLAVENMPKHPDFLLIDGNQLIQQISIPQQTIIKGDALSLSIAAASIIAKVTRDRLMADFAREFPNFRFDIHKGYGTRQHQEELQKFGPTPIHRYSFRGVGPNELI